MNEMQEVQHFEAELVTTGYTRREKFLMALTATLVVLVLCAAAGWIISNSHYQRAQKNLTQQRLHSVCLEDAVKVGVDHDSSALVIQASIGIVCNGPEYREP